MNEIVDVSVSSLGKTVFDRACIRPLDESGYEDGLVTVVRFCVGNLGLSVFFETAEEMIEFCQRHNIDYIDEREYASKEAEVAA